MPAAIEKLLVKIALWYRRRQYGFTFRIIKLTQGKYAIVDPEDYVELNRHKWFAKNDKNTYYAARIENGKKIYMHRQIMRPPFDGSTALTAGSVQGRGRLVVDHINHKGFDNRKINLQIVTRQENNWNSRKTIKNCSSKYKGVSRCKKTNKWRAVICVNGQDMHLGYFEDESEAAKAYDEAAKKYRGDFAVLNFSHSPSHIRAAADKPRQRRINFGIKKEAKKIAAPNFRGRNILIIHRQMVDYQPLQPSLVLP